jgi:hypothetical protein
MSEWGMVIVIVLVTVVVPLLGLVLVRRIAPIEALAAHTDVAGYVYAVIGVIYAVILAFVVVVGWEQFRDAEMAVAAEASAVLNLARMANGWPAADHAAVEAALAGYARHVIQVEWPAMARGDFTPANDPLSVNQLWQALNQADATAAAKSASYEAAIGQLDALGTARDERVVLGQEGLPPAMTVILVIGAVVTVTFTYLFVVNAGWLHALMIGSLAGLLALLLFLENQLTAPFQGVVTIPPTQMEMALAEIEAGPSLRGMSMATPVAPGS